MTNDHPVKEALGQVATAAPSASVIVAKVLGLTLPDWVSICTIIVLSLQALYLLWKWVKEARS